MSPRQKTAEINKTKATVPELINIPANYFVADTIGSGLLGTGLLKPRPNVETEYVSEITMKGNPLLTTPQTYSYFFVEYNNSNITGIGDKQKSFVVILTLSPITLNSCSEMLGTNIKTITGIDENLYLNGTFYHPTYVNDNGTPLEFRYAEIPILRQRTPGRLDNVPIGYPDFDSTPDGVVTVVGPQPSAPYPNFISSTGATSSVTVGVGGTVQFLDATTKTPWQIAPTGWYWEFGGTSYASPTGSTAQNPLVTYGMTGTYSVTLTASNATGSSTITKQNFVIVV